MSTELLAGYPDATGRYDELVASAREPRPHWKPFLASLAAEPAERMRERLQAVQSQVRESYNFV